MKSKLVLRVNLWITDVGFLTYWFVTALGVLPESWLFKDYENPILKAWNWSFLPLDLLASVLGLTSLYLARKDSLHWRSIALMSLCLTFTAGFMAITFFALRGDFEAQWWIPNTYLTLWPILCVYPLLCEQYFHMVKVPSEPPPEEELPVL
jgi:hypothetical protein